MEDVGVISSIKVERPETWEKKNFLTIDVDWAHDEILLDAIELFEQRNISATWFITHQTPILERLQSNRRFELGIHPNFEFLLQGDQRKGRDAEEVVDRLLEVVPKARVVRSHCMAQSTRLLDIFREKGLSHDCNHFVPQQKCAYPIRLIILEQCF